MSVKVAINGFGRIGRLAFRQMFGDPDYEIVAINDLTSSKMLAHLLKYDSTQGNYALTHKVEFNEGEGEDNYIVVDGKKIVIYKMPNAADLPWGKLGVEVVLECTGFYTKKEKAQAHIDAGAKKVVISAPAGNDLPTIVYNVNHEKLTKEDNIISAASCTTNCLAPMAKALNDYAPILSGIMTTVHAYTGDQMPLDGPQRKGDLRRSRAAAVNIVPNSTGAAKAIGLVIPELAGKLIGSAQRVPTPTGSTTILIAVVKKADVTVEGINAALQRGSDRLLRHHRQPLRLHLRRHPDHGLQDQRRLLPGPGRLLVRQRELLHQPDGPHHQVLLQPAVRFLHNSAGVGACRPLFLSHPIPKGGRA